MLRFLDVAPRASLKRALPWERLERRLDDRFLCLDRSQGVFCYLLARALGRGSTDSSPPTSRTTSPVCDPANGFRSAELQLNEGTELSVRVAPDARVSGA